MSRLWAVTKRLLRVPSFRISCAIGLLAPLALLAWAFVDAWFWHTIRTVGGLTGIGQPYVDPNTVHSRLVRYDERLSGASFRLGY